MQKRKTTRTGMAKASAPRTARGFMAERYTRKPLRHYRGIHVVHRRFRCLVGAGLSRLVRREARINREACCKGVPLIATKCRYRGRDRLKPAPAKQSLDTVFLSLDLPAG